MPQILIDLGVTPENYHLFYLAVLKSIYGESDAQLLFARTVARILVKLGFEECVLEEGVFFRVLDDSPQIMTRSASPPNAAISF